MKILDLKLQAFGPFLNEQHIPFQELNDKGMFLINGPTGTGKTSIFDAIVFALYGKGSGKDRNDGKSLRSDFAKDENVTFVDLTFEANGHKYRVVRRAAYYRKAKRGEGLTPVAASAELYMPDDTIISNPKNVDDTLENKILFINRDQFKNIALLAQGEFTELITASSKERADILVHIFQKEIYDSFQSELSALAKKAEDDQKSILSSMNTLIVNVENGEQIIGFREAFDDSSNIPTFLENIKETICKIKEEQKRAKETTEKAQSEYTQAQNNLSNVNKNNELISAYLKSLETLETLKQQEPLILGMKKLCDTHEEYLQIKPILEHIRKVDFDIATFENTIIEIQKKIDSIKVTEKFLVENSEKHDAAKRELLKENSIKDNLNILNKQRQKLVIFKGQIEKEESIYVAQYKNFLSLEEQYKTTRDRFFASSSYNLAKELKEGMTCPVCGSKSHPKLASAIDVVSEADFKTIENRFEKDRKAVEALKSQFDSNKNSLKAQEAQMTDTLKNNGFEDESIDFIYSNEINNLIHASEIKINNLDSFIKSYESSKANFEKDKASFEQELKSSKEALNSSKSDLVYSKESLQSKLEINALFKSIEQAKAFDNERGGAKLNLTKSKEAYEKFNTEKIASETTIQNTPAYLIKIGKVDESELVQLVNEKKSVFDEAQIVQNALANTISNLSNSKEAIKRKYDECKEILNRFSSLSELSKTANGFNRMHLSFKMYILADYFEKIIVQANRRLFRITNGRYKLIRRLELGKGNAQQGLDLDVFDNETGKNRPASSLSGGEKFVSALSMALGLSDIIETNHALIQVESIFIDEGFGSLDENYLDMAMKALESLKDDNKTVAIISHVEKLKEYIPNGIEVQKDSIGSKIFLKDNV